MKEVRVIDAEGNQLGIIPTSEALQRADESGLQLVEVNSKASPPVCKIMDYGKFKYETAKRERETKKNKKTQELKEVKYRPKTAGHDFEFKTKHARRFIEEGHKVRLLVQFRGREMIHPETGKAVLDRVCKELADVATIQTMPRMEGNRMNMLIAPKPQRGGGGGGGGGAAKTKPKAEEGEGVNPASPEAPETGDASDAPEPAPTISAEPEPESEPSAADAPVTPDPEGPEDEEATED